MRETTHAKNLILIPFYKPKISFFNYKLNEDTAQGVYF